MEPSSRWRGQAAIAVAVALVGFLLAVQLRTQPSFGQRLEIEREADLAQLLADLGQRSDELLEEIADLRVRLATQTGSAQQERVLLENARGQIAAIEVLLGLVPVRGPGIAVTILDPEGTVGPEVLLDAVQELRDAGAEAIEINRRRIVAQSAFGGSPGRLSVGGRAVRAPYRIVAVGDPDTLSEAMRIPGGVIDAVASRPGASARVAEARRLFISSLHAPPRLSYARPVQRR